MTIPKAFIEQNHLQEGAQVELQLEGARLTVEVPRRRYKLDDLLAEMPRNLPRVKGWDEMSAVGREIA